MKKIFSSCFTLQENVCQIGFTLYLYTKVASLASIPSDDIAELLFYRYVSKRSILLYFSLDEICCKRLYNRSFIYILIEIHFKSPFKKCWCCFLLTYGTIYYLFSCISTLVKWWLSQKTTLLAYTLI